MTTRKMRKTRRVRKGASLFISQRSTYHCQAIQNLSLGQGGKRNPKSRMPKSERMTNDESRSSSFGLPSDFGFRPFQCPFEVSILVMGAGETSGARRAIGS